MIQHALTGCRLSRIVWSILADGVPGFDLSWTMNCFWMEFLSFWSSNVLLVKALQVGWMLWNNRNNCFFNSLCETPASINKIAISMAADYRSAHWSELVVNEALVQLASCWIAPILGFYKLNVDTSYNCSTKEAWGGMVLRCYKGEVVVAARKRFEGITSVCMQS